MIKRIHKITRLSYNSTGWERPTGEARKYEAKSTYNYKNGFGHEDWIFRSKWIIDGWRYAFVQGVGKGRTELFKLQMPFDLTLFSIDPEKKRQYIAKIESCECLSEEQASDAIEEFRDAGWFKQMIAEVEEVGGDETKIRRFKTPSSIFNIRYKVENLKFFPDNTFADDFDPVHNMSRYQLHDFVSETTQTPRSRKSKPKGSNSLPNTSAYNRDLHKLTSRVCTREHAKMQMKLMLELRSEYPDGKVVREADYVDVFVKSGSDVILYEIKTELEPRMVIRQALGQLLEYAYHPDCRRLNPTRLIIVGRKELSNHDKYYLEFLQQTCKLPLTYRSVDSV